MFPRLTARHLLLAAAALLSACSSPVAPSDAALRTDTDKPAACSGVFGGVSTRSCEGDTSLTGSTDDTTIESTTLRSACSGVFGGVSTRECLTPGDSSTTGN